MSNTDVSRYDQKLGVDYAHCEDCAETFPTREEMSAHLSATFKAGKGHRARVTNPTRIERIERELSDLAESALSDLMFDVQRLVDNEGVSDEEIASAGRWVHMDFSDAWKEFCE